MSAASKLIERMERETGQRIDASDGNNNREGVTCSTGTGFCSEISICRRVVFGDLWQRKGGQ